ncbi:ankyrin-1-like [Mytilus californianus]|uniref:ankyrin-1-like n=1 Tax=Mytilus californianus TaxID=6549 RepID=UPI0022474FF6|nr:ankyrin-1-like [Mytilus californianus]
MFVVTKATKYVKSFLKYKRRNVVVVTGSSGNGKSSIIHHVALELYFKYGYEVIPFVTGPQDIINFRDPTTKQVFVVDDICGKEAINVSLVELWRDHSEKLAKIFEVNEESKNNHELDPVCTQMSSPKLLVSCRLHLYRDVHVKLLKLQLFKRSECNLLSTELCLSYKEKMKMVKRYVPDKMCYSWGRESFDFFPLLCKLAVGKNSDEIDKLFSSPVDTIEYDLKQFITWQNKYQLCALVLCILFLNGFNTDWLKLEYAPILERDKIKKVVDECGININLERKRKCLKCCFESLELTYLKKKFGNIYIMIHDKINEIAAFLYGQHLTECFIKYAPTSFVRDHYRFQSFERKENDKIITLSENMRGEYLNRLIRDMKQGDIVSTLSNKNLVIDTIRAGIIKAFQHDPDVRLAMKQYSHSMYSAPIMEAAAQGFADIVKVLFDLKYVECDINFSNWFWKTPLFAACEGGHTTVVKLLLENGARFYGCGEHGCSLLQVSCSKGHIGVVELLLQESFGFFRKKKRKRSNRVTSYAAREKIENYVNISKVDTQGRSSLFLACKEGHTNIVKLLLDRNADPLKSNNRGQSPLMSACKKGHQNIVELLLKNNVNVNKKRKDGRAALHFACKGGYSAVVKLLIEYKANVSQRGWAGQSPLYEACEGGHIEVVKILLKNNADVTQSAKYGKTPLYAACKEGHICIVKELLENKADIFQSDKFGKSPLYMACQTGNKDTVHLLLENGANVNQCDQRNQSPLFVACGRGYLDIAKLLLKTNNLISKSDVHGQTPLHIACKGGHIDIVECLLDQGAKINQQGRTGQTPIYFACSRGHIDVVNVLLNNNADVLIRNKYKRSPLYVACEMGYTYIVQLLLQHCADVLGCDKFETSPLHTACKGGHKEIVKLLLQKNADINQCDSYGQSPLHIACRGNNSQYDPRELFLSDESYTDIVHLLLEMHADVTLCDNQGFTPLSIAKTYGNVDTVRLFSQNDCN